MLAPPPQRAHGQWSPDPRDHCMPHSSTNGVLPDSLRPPQTYPMVPDLWPLQVPHPIFRMFRRHCVQMGCTGTTDRCVVCWLHPIVCVFVGRPCGPTDKASDYGSGDSRFESWQGRFFFLFFFSCFFFFLLFFSPLHTLNFTTFSSLYIFSKPVSYSNIFWNNNSLFQFHF